MIKKSKLIACLGIFAIGTLVGCGSMYVARTISASPLGSCPDAGRLYQRHSDELVKGYGKLQKGMERADVERVIALPPDHFLFDSDRGSTTWHWNAATKLPNFECRREEDNKGHYTLSVTFGSDGKVVRFLGGIN